MKKEASFYLIVFYCLNYLLLRLAESCPDFLHRCFVVVPSRKGGFSLRCVCVFVDREECLEGITVIPRGEGFRERERERKVIIAILGSDSFFFSTGYMRTPFITTHRVARYTLTT